MKLPVQDLISGTGCSIVFAALIFSAASVTNGDDPKAPEADFQPPELLYLTWQEENPRDPDGKLFPVWKPGGELLSDEAAGELRKQVKDFALFNAAEDQLHPLILIFQVDERAETSPVMPNFLNAAGTTVARGGSEIKPHAGLILASLSPAQSDLLLWPEKGSVEVRYPVENPTVAKTIDGPPQGRIDVAQGVTWELDSNYAMERDPQTRRLVRAPNKLAGVLITNPDESDPNVDYEVQVEVRGGKLLTSYLHTAKSNPGGQPSRVDVSPPVENPQQITKLFIVRQRHATKQFKDFPIKRELLFEAAQTDPNDE